jgi:uncharacterized protein (DUF488 family)
MVVYTVGHSSLTAEAFIELLRAHAIARLIDVRRHAVSRRHPQFAAPALARALSAAGIEYRREPDLGGFRDARPDSRNTAWPAKGLRGYADHAASDAFHAALARIGTAAAEAPSAVMCAERLPEQCHRQILADALTLRGVRVVHLLGPHETRPHRLHAAARLAAGGGVEYPAAPSGQLALFAAD